MIKKESILGIKNYNFPTIEISILIVIALCLRLVIVNFEIPLVLDSLTYFSFSYETKVLGHFPEIIPFTNLGWPVVLTSFFTTVPFDSAMDYMNMQKIISMILSSLTIIPTYLLCKNFTDKKYALVASSLLVFEPRIIENSILGLNDALYLLIMTFIFVFFFKSKKFVYVAFGLVALSTQIRAEGVFVFIAISILFFIKFKKDGNVIIKYLICFGIFLLILSPVLVERIEIFQSEFIKQVDDSDKNFEETQSITSKTIRGFENFIKLFGWVTIPTYFAFLIPGFFLMIKKWEKKNLQIIIPMMVMSIPIFFAYSIPAQDTRYLFVLFPFLSIITTFAIKELGNHTEHIKKILPIILVMIIISSVIFLNERIDQTHDKESFLIAKYLVDNAEGINQFYPESSFIRAAEVVKDFPNIPYKDNSGEFRHKMQVFEINENSLDEFILKHKDEGLSHIIVDDKFNRNKIAISIFESEEDFPFLEKIIDTRDIGWEYHFKIFKINYEYFEK